MATVVIPSWKLSIHYKIGNPKYRVGDIDYDNECVKTVETLLTVTVIILDNMFGQCTSVTILDQ